jgi:hypothetical protein
MWIFSKDGFLSAVRNINGDNTIVVRARRKDHLKALVSKLDRSVDIRCTGGTDYRYCIFLSGDEYSTLLSKLGDEIDYTNFKRSVQEAGADFQYCNALFYVWAAMKEIQDC